LQAKKPLRRYRGL